MKLWILRRKDTDNNDTWDEALGFVVRAPSAIAARHMAARECGDEGSGFWTDPQRSTCRELIAGTKTGVVLRSFHAA